MKIRFGTIEMEIDTQEQLDELVMRYGNSTVVVVLQLSGKRRAKEARSRLRAPRLAGHLTEAARTARQQAIRNSEIRARDRI